MGGNVRNENGSVQGAWGGEQMQIPRLVNPGLGMKMEQEESEGLYAVPPVEKKVSQAVALWGELKLEGIAKEKEETLQRRKKLEKKCLSKVARDARHEEMEASAQAFASGLSQELVSAMSKVFQKGLEEQKARIKKAEKDAERYVTAAFTIDDASARKAAIKSFTREPLTYTDQFDVPLSKLKDMDKIKATLDLKGRAERAREDLKNARGDDLLRKKEAADKCGLLEAYDRSIRAEMLRISQQVALHVEEALLKAGEDFADQGTITSNITGPFPIGATWMAEEKQKQTKNPNYKIPDSDERKHWIGPSLADKDDDGAAYNEDAKPNYVKRRFGEAPLVQEIQCEEVSPPKKAPEETKKNKGILSRLRSLRKSPDKTGEKDASEAKPSTPVKKYKQAEAYPLREDTYQVHVEVRLEQKQDLPVKLIDSVWPPQEIESPIQEN